VGKESEKKREGKEGKNGKEYYFYERRSTHNCGTSARVFWDFAPLP
jgi:hypothetical protein